MNTFSFQSQRLKCFGIRMLVVKIGNLNHFDAYCHNSFGVCVCELKRSNDDATNLALHNFD